MEPKQVSGGQLYDIPDSMVKDKTHIRVKFQALPGNSAGAVYYIRLVKQ